MEHLKSSTIITTQNLLNGDAAKEKERKRNFGELTNTNACFGK